LSTIHEGKSLLSPAKVNLCLKVISRRSDGYHNLVSLVDLISLSDTVYLRELEEDEVVVKDSLGILPAGPQNTIFKGIQLFRKHYRVRKGVEVFVEKRIPLGAGLGGGSSNAATVMKELPRLWNVPVNFSELVALGSMVGADVPLFMHGKSCIMRGIGERITPLQLPTLWYILVYPEVALSTKEVYSRLRIVLTKDENEVKVSEHFSTASDIANILENDLEEVALLLCPEITTIKKRLRDAGAVGSLMSGSGSTVFGIFEQKKEAQKALQRVRDLGSVFIAKSIGGNDGDHRG
jgi:4-diphosphocytidyl-2-C-methyl-D-erythritol kinase